jgi:hypothetical protein
VASGAAVGVAVSADELDAKAVLNEGLTAKAAATATLANRRSTRRLVIDSSPEIPQLPLYKEPQTSITKFHQECLLKPA